MRKLELKLLLAENPDWVETLKEALEVEEEDRRKAEEKGSNYLGWEWYEVHTPPQVLNNMVSKRILDIVYASRSSTSYVLRDRDLIREVIEEIEASGVEVPSEEEIPSDLFEIIVGHRNVKTVLRYAIESERPCHVLLVGPPASAKTLFLMELSRLPESYYLLAPTMTSAGLNEVLFALQPKYLLIDEIDRLHGDNLGVLNSLMATGRISETKWGKTRYAVLYTKVFAAGIKVNSLPRDLLSRFIKIRFEPYSRDEFLEVSKSVLEREGVPEDVAEFIALSVWNMYGNKSDVRQCVSIARMANGEKEKAEVVAEVMKRQGVSL